MLAKIPNLEPCSSLDSKDYDGVVVVAPKIEDIKVETIREPLAAFAKVDASAAGGCFVVPSNLPSGKIMKIVNLEFTLVVCWL